MSAARLPSGRASLTMLAALASAGLLAGVLGGARPPPAALAGTVAALGVVVGFARPTGGLAVALLVALLAPFLVVPQRFGAQPPVLDVVVAATYLGIAIQAMQRRHSVLCTWQRMPRWLALVVALGALLPLASGPAALAASGDREATQVAVKMSLYGLTPLIVALTCRSATVFRGATTLVVVAAALQALAAIGLHFAGSAGIEALRSLDAAGYPSTNVARYLPDEATRRATGLLVDPNVLGVTLAAALPFGLTWFGNGIRRTAFGVAVMLLIGVALALTISRASWLATAAGLLTWLALVRPRAAAMAAALLGGAVLAAPVEPFERIRQGFLVADRSAALRVGEIREATRVIGRFPLLGVGYGEAPHPDIFAGVSNAWLWLAERAGILAALTHLALVGGAAWAALRTVAADPAMRPAIASLAAFVVAGVFDHHIVSFPHLVFLVGGLAGLIVARESGPEAPAA